MYVLSWRTVSALTRVLFLFRNSGNKHQNNPLVSAETIRQSSLRVHALFSIFLWMASSNIDLPIYFRGKLYFGTQNKCQSYALLRFNTTVLPNQ